MKKVRVRPSKAQSTMGLIVGVIFVGIGVLFIIPTFGPFGIIWTLITLFFTISNLINVFSDKGLATYEITTDIFEDNKNVNFSKRLRELEKLKDDGLITYEEYEEKRKEIMDEKW